jgi:hypothetical protein
VVKQFFISKEKGWIYHSIPSSLCLLTRKVSEFSTVSSRVAGVDEKHKNQGRTARIEEGRDRYGSMAGCLRRKKNSIVSVTIIDAPPILSTGYI